MPLDTLWHFFLLYILIIFVKVVIQIAFRKMLRRVEWKVETGRYGEIRRERLTLTLKSGEIAAGCAPHDLRLDRGS